MNANLKKGLIIGGSAAAVVAVVLLFIFSPFKAQEDVELEEETIQNEDTTPIEEPEVVVEPEPIEEPEIVEEPEEVEPEPMYINGLTGLEIDEENMYNRPFAVTISNIETALPQYGIEEAEIMYETLAEGGIPRIIAIFKDFNPEKIGPIRSGRHYMYYIATDVNGLYVHYGRSPQALDLFSTGVEHMDGMSNLDNIVCYQDPDRKRPHATFTNHEMLLEGTEIREYDMTLKEDEVNKFLFSEEPVQLDEIKVSYVKLPFSWYTPYFEYDQEDNNYKRFQYGDPHIDANTGNQLVFSNIIVQSVNMWQIPGDPEYRLDMTLTGSGEGYYYSGGNCVKITWEREDYDHVTKYYDENGDEILLNPGKTYIAIFPKNKFNEIIME